MLRYLTPSSVERLEGYAQELTRLAGGERRFTAAEMIGTVVERARPDGIEEVERDGDRAKVMLHFDEQPDQLVEVRKSEEGWRIELSVP
jgi:hypothetical protein